MEYTLGRIRINMKESGLKIKGMEMAVTFLEMVTHMSDNIILENQKVMVNIDGRTDRFILVILKVVLKMGMENGAEKHKNQMV